MAGAKCSPPKGQPVVSHTRARPRRRAGRAARAGGWECYKGGSGCGVHHKSQLTALRHAKQLNRAERKVGRTPSWEPRQR